MSSTKLFYSTPRENTVADMRQEIIYTIQEELLIALEDKGLSKKKLAKQLGISKKEVRKFFKDDQLSFKLATKIAVHLGVTLEIKVAPTTK